MMNPQIILNDGQTAVCRCPTSRDRTDPPTMTSMIPQGAASLAAGKNLSTSMEMLSLPRRPVALVMPQGAASLAADKKRPTSMEMLSLARRPVAPGMMRLSSGRTALRRQNSTDPNIDKKEKILAWIQSKSAYGGKHTVGGAAKLEEQMRTDFKEWMIEFCTGDGEFVLEKDRLLNFTEKGKETFVLNQTQRQEYCEILKEQLDPNRRKIDDTEHSKSPFMYCGFPPFPPLFPKEETSSGEQKSGHAAVPGTSRKQPTQKEQEKRYVLIRARDEYREWWIDKYTTTVGEGINQVERIEKTLKEYWDLLAQQPAGNNTFNDFFLFEEKIDKAIKVLKRQSNVNLDDLVKLERKTSVDSLIKLLTETEEEEGKKKQGGYKKRKSKKRARNKRGGRKSRRKRLKRKTKKRKRKTKRKKRKTKRRR